MPQLAPPAGVPKSRTGRPAVDAQTINLTPALPGEQGPDPSVASAIRHRDLGHRSRLGPRLRLPSLHSHDGARGALMSGDAGQRKERGRGLL